MKRIALLFLSLTVACMLYAQPHGKPNPFHKHKPDIKPLPTPTIIVQAQNAESFYVYLNGDLVNEVPRTQVVIDRLDNNPQEIIVVLNHPVRKAAAVDVYPEIAGSTVYVEYNRPTDQLLITPPPTQLPRHTTDEWVNEMVGILKSQSFDSEKSATAQGLLNNGLPFTSNQIARIAGTFTFSSATVEFLKSAYTHCIDPQNYERALSVLTFSSDRETVRTFINTLR